MTEVTVPAIGESVSEGTLAAWLKKDGEYVEEGEEIFELETDKANLEVPSPASGVLHVTVQEGTDVEVGQPVGSIDTEAEKPSGGSTAPAEAAGSTAAEGEREAPVIADRPSAGEVAELESLAPAVRRILAEHGLNPEEIEGTGKDGRITKEDALKAVERLGQSGNGAAAARTPEATRQEASPRERETPQRPEPAEPRPPASRPQTAGEGGRPQRREPMTRIRQRIAENLVRSKQSSAHLTTFNEADMSAVMELRSAYRDEFQEKHGTRLGFMSFFIKACCVALREYPEVNAFIDGTDIVYNDFFDIGVALSSDRGLITPVVRGADRKSFADIEAEIVSFAKRAKEKKLRPDELSGATFTITNGGVFGSMLSTPIPSPPQSGILGMHSIQKRPVVVNDEIVVRPMMYLALSYDHRIIDGREAIGFLMTVKRCIEDPHRMMLDI